MSESWAVMESKVKAFNENNPMGSPVVVIKDNGEQVETVIWRPAEILSSHTEGSVAVIWLDGLTGAYLLNRVINRDMGSDMNRKDTVNATRQILMNELGLTRESVREAMMKIVEDVVSKHLTKIMKDGTLDRIIGTELAKQYHRAGSKWTALDKQIRAAVRSAADTFVEKNVHITNICNAPKTEVKQVWEGEGIDV
jgi:hypothetical protein